MGAYTSSAEQDDVQVVGQKKKRKLFTAEEKQKAVELSHNTTVAFAAEKFGVKERVIYRWRKRDAQYAALSKKRKNLPGSGCLLKSNAFDEKRRRHGKKVLQAAKAEQLRKHQTFEEHSSDLSNDDPGSDEENADSAGADADDPFAVDSEERAEAERFLKEQELLQERRRQKLGASSVANQSASTLASDSLDLDAINARLNELNTIRQLSFGDDVPSCKSWEVLSTALEDNVPDDEADRDQEQAQQFVERSFSGRLSVSTFGSGSKRSSFYRDSPSLTRTPVRQDECAATKLKTTTNKLRFDNDSSEDETDEPSPASAVSYKTANELVCSYETVASASEHSQRRNPRSRLGDYTSSTGPGNSSMESNDFVLVRGSLKRRSNNLGSFDLLGSMSQKMRRMGVREALSNATASHTGGTSERHAVNGNAPRKESSKGDANVSFKPLFEEIQGEPHGYTFTNAHLGEGNFGAVNVAVREYAVKRVNGKDPESAKQCTQGVTLLRRISHENIIRMKKAFRDVCNDVFYVVMDKMEGSVADFIQYNRGCLNEQHALVVLRCTANALDYLHNKLGFVHRDVKSDNVLVGRNCEVKLADLDSAAAEDASLNGIAGTPHWIAPEVARVVCGQSTDPYTAKVDVWSFAIFATEFPLGVPPYFTGEEPNLPELCGTIRSPQYVECVNEMMRAENCPDVARLVEYCLKADPVERPSISDVQALMSILPEPDQQVLLEPIQLMVQRRAEALKAADRHGSSDRGAATAGDGYDSFESQ